jgi:hypothetical protein
MKTKSLLVLSVLALGTLAATPSHAGWSVGINIGVPVYAPARVVVAAPPVCAPPVVYCPPRPICYPTVVYAPAYGYGGYYYGGYAHGGGHGGHGYSHGYHGGGHH